MRIRAFLALLQPLLHIGQISRPFELPLLRLRSMSIDPIALFRGPIRLVRTGFGIQAPPRPVVRQSARVQDRLRLDVLAHRDVQIVQLDPLVPVAGEVIDDAHGQACGGGDDRRRLRILAPEGDGDAALAAEDGFEGPAHGTGG